RSSASPRGATSAADEKKPRVTSEATPSARPATTTPSADQPAERPTRLERERPQQQKSPLLAKSAKNKGDGDKDRADAAGGDDDRSASPDTKRVAGPRPAYKALPRRKAKKRSSRRPAFSNRYRGRKGRRYYPDMLGGAGGGGYYRPTYAWRWIDSSRITSADNARASRARMLAWRRASRLQQSLSAQPLRRSLHRALHRAAMRAGRPDAALDHARKWVALEGRRLEALRALADARAALGESAAAMRVYASMVDVNSWRSSVHRELARMYRRKGDLRRACSHRWSLVSLRPQAFGRYETLARCLSAAGQGDLARSVLDEAAARKLSRHDKRRLAKLRSVIERGALDLPPARRWRRLRLRASWDGGVDLDLALLSPYGRRVGLYGDWRGGTINDSRDGVSAETLGYHASNGRYVVEIARGSSKDSDKVVRGTVVVRVGRRARTVPFVLEAGATSKRIALVQVHRVHRLVRSY
ncbi:MAG: hypothetical protein KC503_42570, partial [Myxococcales bacterium]|nr:hypothetical protein [Myxococcales bacterium]